MECVRRCHMPRSTIAHMLRVAGAPHRAATRTTARARGPRSAWGACSRARCRHVSAAAANAALCHSLLSRCPAVTPEQLHPRNVGLWIRAATHEVRLTPSVPFCAFERHPLTPVAQFGAGGSTHVARTMFQRGLRVNARSRELWLAYFGMELQFLDKARAKRCRVAMRGRRRAGCGEARGARNCS